MKITAVETVRVEAWSNLVWVRLHTDEGPVGLGETFRNPAATESYIHETCAPYLLGRDPCRINALDHGLRNEVGGRFTGYPTRSVAYRGTSAVDLALWDLFGQALGRPLADLLGGRVRERMRIYNTCASATYNARIFDRRDISPSRPVAWRFGRDVRPGTARTTATLPFSGSLAVERSSCPGNHESGPRLCPRPSASCRARASESRIVTFRDAKAGPTSCRPAQSV